MRSLSISATNVRIRGDEKSAYHAPSAGDQGSEFAFVSAWHLRDPNVERDAQEFWRGTKLVPETEFERRLPELWAAAYAQGKIVAVATAEPFLLSHLAMFQRTTLDAPDLSVA